MTPTFFVNPVVLSMIHPKDNDFFFASRHNHQSVVAAALRVVGNIVTGDDCQTQVKTLIALFSKKYSFVKAEISIFA